MTMSYGQQIQTELAPRERLLWRGPPPAGMTGWDWLCILLSLLFGLPFAGNGALLIAKPIAEPKHSSLLLFGIPLLLAGLVIIGLPYHDLRQRRRTAAGRWTGLCASWRVASGSSRPSTPRSLPSTRA
ncbi:MAG: hypothetical protein M3Q03_07490 [Chloroflexota bacterium]|nr:hypothetical protein [Chloroflexota bacterium]